MISWVNFYDGLSLCIQGTRYSSPKIPKCIRFIPVYTGNTIIYGVIHARFAVYPCVYREHSGSSNCTDYRRGLSLCIQGTLQNILEKKKYCRFIPVYTGNTSANNYKLLKNPGLSLCIQGTHFDRALAQRSIRFIPVYTGNTCPLAF